MVIGKAYSPHYPFQSMYKNELAIVSIKPSLAYGSQGRKPDIPPDSRITYLFGLLHFEKQKDISEMTWAQVRNLKMQVAMTICFVMGCITSITMYLSGSTQYVNEIY